MKQAQILVKQISKIPESVRRSSSSVIPDTSSDESGGRRLSRAGGGNSPLTLKTPPSSKDQALKTPPSPQASALEPGTSSGDSESRLDADQLKIIRMCGDLIVMMGMIEVSMIFVTLALPLAIPTALGTIGEDAVSPQMVLINGAVMLIGELVFVDGGTWVMSRNPYFRSKLDLGTIWSEKDTVAYCAVFVIVMMCPLCWLIVCVFENCMTGTADDMYRWTLTACPPVPDVDNIRG